MAADAGQAAEFTAYDMVETERHVLVYVDVPGMSDDAFSLEYDGGALVVDGQRSAFATAERHRFVAQARHAGPFHAVIPLPDELHLDPASLEAEYAAGVLEVTLRKVAAEPRVMVIQFGSSSTAAAPAAAGPTPATPGTPAPAGYNSPYVQPVADKQTDRIAVEEDDYDDVY
ncbi:heat shock protein [Thecamonas trahens ATCC 50062]|uniref:Heat shock protein n=1 Tax=Thecamonas trahens ATCC 50062 TaxID=461836 RepID=A0A0L0DUE0_THETB|nr:heat shock protein [Thecamonas trahens ATCC 50062]KNC55954.1 heat shock protein [Thecamonas trahens ATCC 50062]|eukprot:XP_013752695.1 heat shock protein [Thecamonas trahens ATCC 50062]